MVSGSEVFQLLQSLIWLLAGVSTGAGVPPMYHQPIGSEKEEYKLSVTEKIQAYQMGDIYA